MLESVPDADPLDVFVYFQLRDFARVVQAIRNASETKIKNFYDLQKFIVDNKIFRPKCIEWKKDVEYIAITYPWSLNIDEFFDLLTETVHGSDYIWYVLKVVYFNHA